jgi:hypothetical protein
MFDVEIVCIAPHSTAEVARHTEQAETHDLAKTRAYNAIFRLADSGVLSTHVVWLHGESIGYAYTAEDPHDIVGFANLHRVSE